MTTPSPPPGPRRTQPLFLVLMGVLGFAILVGIFQGGVAFGNWLAGERSPAGQEAAEDAPERAP